MKNLNYECILEESKTFIVDKNNSYIKSYIEFIKYFQEIQAGDISEHNLIIGSHFVYGWMPTILNLNLEEKSKVLFLLNAVKAGHILSASDIEILKKAINNSLVGLSKLLHFINPHYYAIWDSRIFRYITGQKSSYGIDKTENYLNYLKRINEISQHKNYEKIHCSIESHFDYELTPPRVIEIIMFEADRKKST